MSLDSGRLSQRLGIAWRESISVLHIGSALQHTLANKFTIRVGPVCTWFDYDLTGTFILLLHLLAVSKKGVYLLADDLLK